MDNSNRSFADISTMSNRPWDFDLKSNVGPYTAFSTSPSQLQEVTLDPETSGTISISQIHNTYTNGMGESVSSSSMKQYEEQLGILRKENFHLKLRIYFLEERLGSGTPIPVQGVVEDNVKLQVELEELRRQLSEKQELLTAAAKAMDVLEQQVNKNVISGKDICDSDESSALKFNVQHLAEGLLSGESFTSKKMPQNDKNMDKVISSDMIQEFTEDEKEELSKLKRDHLAACQMIRGCMLKIKKLEKEIKEKDSKLEDLSKKMTNPGSFDRNDLLDKIKHKDDCILELEKKLFDMGTVQNSLEIVNKEELNKTAHNSLQELLTKRLQGLAYFLDSLLSHKCVIGQEKREMARNLLEQSLAFLDETMAGDLTVDESNLDVTNLLKLEDLTQLLGHHQLGERTDDFPNPRLNATWAENLVSESDCWSEPDRSVSLARMGLATTLSNFNIVTSDESRCRNRRNRSTITSKIDHSESADKRDLLIAEISALTQDKLCLEENLKKQLEVQSELLDKSRELQNKLQEASDEKDKQIENLTAVKKRVAAQEEDLKHKDEELDLCKTQYNEIDVMYKKEQEKVLKLKIELQECEHRYKAKLKSAEEQFEDLKEIERSLRRQVDEATLQASQSALDRTRNAHERLNAERNIEQLRIQLEESETLRREAELKVAALDVKLSELAGEQEILQQQLQLAHVTNSDDDRPTSPDLGIDSDRLSSLENLNVLTHQSSKNQLLRENKELREKLERSKLALAEAVSHLNEANSRKHRVQRAICRQIHKTHDVLRQARSNLQPQQRSPQSNP